MNVRVLFVALVICTFLTTVAQAATLCVKPGKKGCYATISTAVSAAASGDTVDVTSGSYQEMVTITKPLTLQGHGVHGQSTVIDAAGLPPGQAHAIYVHGVTTGPVVISGFTAEHAQREGILIEDSTQVTVTNNTVTDNDQGLNRTPPCPDPKLRCCPGAFPFDQDDCGEGLHLRGVADSVVADNIVQNNAGGILLTDETGATHNNLVTRNVVRNNVPDCGITLPSHPTCTNSGANDATGCIPNIGAPSPGVFQNEVANNTSIGNGAAGTGIFTPTPGTKAYSNLVIDNVLQNNQQGGVVLHSHVAGQVLNDNIIIGNVISGNGGDPDSEGDDSPPPVGIVVFSDASGSAAPITGTIISQNIISNEAVDVFVGTTATDARVFLNDLPGKGSIGIKNVGTSTVDAMNNYWGCQQGPNDPQCSSIVGTVLFTPFLSRPNP